MPQSIALVSPVSWTLSSRPDCTVSVQAGSLAPVTATEDTPLPPSSVRLIIRRSVPRIRSRCMPIAFTLPSGAISILSLA
ncbi:hypothetical protein LP420_11740 [Massilia sp. B-10]|nr:hypothetical protein LP420_11740 [Massilia sp. B-10]